MPLPEDKIKGCFPCERSMGRCWEHRYPYTRGEKILHGISWALGWFEAICTAVGTLVVFYIILVAFAGLLGLNAIDEGDHVHAQPAGKLQQPEPLEE